ncbi:hypothetical protein BCF44_117124 [Kutzneria buriramensis]|uniref:Uncharacterized protein n=1 Tax=Kutzneria buriramensis TaxID=1045776 RepID=A0A3E0H1M8_9PSEU|nr:hypothetical protein BCF44_117124 [Kutzneria buriramensis]
MRLQTWHGYPKSALPARLPDPAEDPIAPPARCAPGADTPPAPTPRCRSRTHPRPRTPAHPHPQPRRQLLPTPRPVPPAADAPTPRSLRRIQRRARSRLRSPTPLASVSAPTALQPLDPLLRSIAPATHRGAACPPPAHATFPRGDRPPHQSLDPPARPPDERPASPSLQARRTRTRPPVPRRPPRTPTRAHRITTLRSESNWPAGPPHRHAPCRTVSPQSNHTSRPRGRPSTPTSPTPSASSTPSPDTAAAGDGAGNDRDRPQPDLLFVVCQCLTSHPIELHDRVAAATDSQRHRLHLSVHSGGQLSLSFVDSPLVRRYPGSIQTQDGNLRSRQRASRQIGGPNWDYRGGVRRIAGLVSPARVLSRRPSTRQRRRARWRTVAAATPTRPTASGQDTCMQSLLLPRTREKKQCAGAR